jgi:poly(3-hydroxybutyrate) depolymerase
MRAIATILFALSTASAAPPAGKVVKETFAAGGKTRVYYLLVPEKVKPDDPAPLIVLLHGSGRDGKSLIDPWQSFAKQEGIILVAPDANVQDGWNTRDDGPDFLYALIEMLRVQHPLDPRRIYLFGHSAGAGHALAMAVLESEYFAAAAVHAGVLPREITPMVERAPRKIPVALWIGTNDSLFPVSAVRATGDVLQSHGFPADVTEIGGHTHNYYGRSPDINKQAWQFLQKHRLDGEPKFRRYDIR